MIWEILEQSGKLWREIATLATPLDSKKPTVYTKNPKNSSFEAYTDDKTIFINIDEPKIKKEFEKIIIPIYSQAAPILYGVKKPASDLELLVNLTLDSFLFFHFHEQLHPWVCPNSKEDERKITKALYDGIKKVEPGLNKSTLFMKVNNSKNLIWDVIDNGFFLRKTSVETDNLAEKISFVFQKDGRKIQSQPIISYPKGILPIAYLISANNHTTDIPISLMGSFYTSLSYNDAEIRKKAMNFFIEDLKSKKIEPADSMKLLQELYL